MMLGEMTTFSKKKRKGILRRALNAGLVASAVGGSAYLAGTKPGRRVVQKGMGYGKNRFNQLRSKLSNTTTNSPAISSAEPFRGRQKSTMASNKTPGSNTRSGFNNRYKNAPRTKPSNSPTPLSTQLSQTTPTSNNNINTTVQPPGKRGRKGRGTKKTKR